MLDNFSPVVAGLGLGIALAGAPGSVQAVLLTEAVRGGINRGFRALAGANLTFGFLLVCLALGLSLATPDATVLRLLKLGGGAFLLWLAVDGLRSGGLAAGASRGGREVPPAARGALAVVLNPGAWLFMAAVASPLFATATQLGGVALAVLAALALMVGVGIGDFGVVLVGGLGVRRAGQDVERWVRRGLAIVLAGVGAWLIIVAFTS